MITELSSPSEVDNADNAGIKNDVADDSKRPKKFLFIGCGLTTGGLCVVMVAIFA